jgi:D-3-phosphoglycerate dehydrogenase / 2-oxoglutarate reductase
VKILLTHTPQMRQDYYGARSLKGLQALGDVLLHEGDEALDAAALVAAAEDADIIVSDRKTEGPGEIFGKLPKLRAFIRCAVDVRNIDVEAATKQGILVTQAGPGFQKSVSEMAIGYMIDLSRHISRATADYQAGKMPDVVMGRQLSGSTAGIMGYGSIGSHLAPILKAMGMTVLVADPYAKVHDPEIKHVSLEELLAKSDYVVCLVVATEETENLMNAAAFARMQPSAFFINLSRGNLVDEAALLAALKGHAIAGAALDVGREPDQMPSRIIAKLPNVIATPHTGALTPPSIEYQSLETVQQVAKIINGEAPVGSVNASAWTRNR